MKLKKTLLVLFLATAALSLNSCWILVGAAVGAGTIAYVQGEYSMNVNGGVNDTYNAALKAVQDNDNFVLTKKTVTPDSATIEGATKTDSTDFSIDIEALTSKASKVSIKFGTFGDRAASEALMAQINKNL